MEPRNSFTKTIADYGETLRQDPQATIVPSGTDGHGMALSIVEKLAASGAHGAEKRLELAATLGEGGRGIVRLARQVTLEREVAVKAVRADMRSATATTDLLHEAWVTGALEHPNVVPVYDLALDDDGQPLIVFKRIDGVTWTRLMHDAEAVEERFGTSNLLEWNLGILMQVINAVRFAHSRGILHRDIKPDNVMIGEFGEVYVLDWGLAVSVRDDGSGRLPLAADAHDLAGTPSYMAPEMLGGSASEISERTDIYLLGATLFELLAGHPPHMGSPLQLLQSVVDSRPDIPAAAPLGLARICRKAMAGDPAERFARAEEMRLAIQSFLQFRGSEQLCQHAEARRDEMERIIEATSAGTAEHRQLLYNLYGACRFGFLEALSTWRENEVARRGLERATTAMVEFELAQDDPRSAAALMADVAELGEFSPELRRRVDDALAARERERERVARMEQLGRDLDVRVGSRTRIYIIVTIGVLWTFGPLAAALFEDINDVFPGNLRMAMWPGLTAVLLALLAYWGRHSLLQTTLNRRLAWGGGVMMLAQTILHLGTEFAGYLPVIGQTYQMFMWFCVLALIAVIIDLRILPSAGAYLIGFFVVGAIPDQRFFVVAAVNAAIFTHILFILRPRQRPES